MPLDASTTRRGLLQAGGAAALLCTIGGEEISLDGPGAAANADAAAARVRRPVTARAAQSPADRPQPQSGGRDREYWIQARTVTWNVAPTPRDGWHDRPLRGPFKFRAFAYQAMGPGFSAPLGPPTIPGPKLYGEVGDVLVVHFRNAERGLRQGITMHPHGVRYGPEYDGAYLGEHTRAGGFVPPGEEFTYFWECTPDSVGAWPYHDHGPNHTLNTMRGLFGWLVVRDPSEPPPTREYGLFLHELTPPVTGLPRAWQAINGRTMAGNTPTLRASVGDDIAIHVFGMDNDFHTFHVHGHRWKDPAGRFVDTPTVGPNETITARWVEDNPGRWLYHCHVFSHQDGGMTGWYIVD